MTDLWRHCTPRCRSKNHAAWLMSVITKSTSDIENILCLSRCYNAGLVSDELGHTVLHIAAACGKKKVLSWLCTNFRVNVNAKDLCSGWTPLHYAIYHGQIDAAISLILAGADLYMKDYNFHTPLDYLKNDVRPYVMISDDADVFTWGSNASYTLGQPNGQSKANPENLPIWSCEVGNTDQPRRLLSIADVVMTKYTSFYLATNGRVFACGSGRGGRLGLGSEQTVLPPTLIQMLASKQVVCISANVNHSAFVTSEGHLFVTGINDQQQLGLGVACSKEIAPKLVRFKKDAKLKSVVCGRFHTAVMSDRELFTCGLNAGQLGLLKDTPFQAEFKLVTAVAAAARDSQNGPFLALLACSDSATVVKTNAGDVLALMSYGCKKIATNCPAIVHIVVNGGRLDHTTAPEILRAEKGTDLTVLMLIGDSGQILFWRENAQSSQGGVLRELRCTGLGRDLVATWVWAPMTASDGRILVCANDGNAFVVTLSPTSQIGAVKENKTKPAKTEWSAFHVADRGRGVQFRANSYELASSTIRIKHIHRAVKISADPTLANFACIQSRPETAVAELPVSASCDLVADMNKLLEMTASPYDSGTDVELVFGSNICLYAHKAVSPAKTSPNKNNCKKKNSPKNKQQQQNSAEQKLHLSEAAVVNAQMLGRLVELTKRFNMGGATLANELGGLQNSSASGRAYAFSFCSSVKLSFEYEALEELADVWLRSLDGHEFYAHRCVLSSRSDYFASMLAVGRWAEAGHAVISQPVDRDVLEMALTYIYTDWLGEVTDWKLLCKLIVYADQIFLNGLKSVAEVQLSMSPRLNLSNCCQLIDFAHAYRAEVLLRATVRFAVANMPTLLETHFPNLSSVDDDALAEVSRTYLRIACPPQRAIKPWSSVAPSQEQIDAIVTEATNCHLLVDDDLDALQQNISDMLAADSKDVKEANFTTVSQNAIARVAAGRNRRQRRRSNNSESSDGGSSGSGGGPIFIATSTAQLAAAPLSPSTHSPALKSGVPMSPSFSGRVFNPINEPSCNPITTMRKTVGWSTDNLTAIAPSGGNGEVSSLANIMADEKRQQENDRNFRNKSRPRNLVVQIPSMSSGFAGSPPNGNNTMLASSPPNKLPPCSPSTTFRGWGCLPSSPLPTSPMPILADIVRQELQRTENTRRQDRRSLHQIQLEERAIEELTKLYADLEAHGVAVTVERMTVGVSAPTWLARSAPLSSSFNTNNNNNINNFPALSAAVNYR